MPPIFTLTPGARAIRRRVIMSLQRRNQEEAASTSQQTLQQISSPDGVVYPTALPSPSDLAGDAVGPPGTNVVERVQGQPFAATAPGDGDVWAYSASSGLWVPTALAPPGATDHGSLTGLADDDHGQYQKGSEKGAASGYAGLDAGTHVPQAQLGSGSGGAGTKVLYDDQTYKIPSGGGAAHTIEDETTPLTTRSKLSFQGAGVTATDDSGNDRTVVTIPGGSGGGLGAYILIEDQRASGTASGSLASGAWRTRPINTVVHDTGGDASVVANQFVLQPGVYRLHAWGYVYNVARNAMRLQNITDGTTVLNGGAAYSNGDASAPALLTGRFTIATAKTFELQHRVEFTSGTHGFGVAVGTVFAVDHEVFTSIELWKE